VRSAPFGTHLARAWISLNTLSVLHYREYISGFLRPLLSLSRAREDSKIPFYKSSRARSQGPRLVRIMTTCSPLTAN